MTIPALTVSNVSGTIGLPALPIKAATFAAQRIVATLMNTELFAMCRPTQILLLDLNQVDSWRHREFIPLSETLKQMALEYQQRKKNFDDAYKGYVPCT